MPEDQVPRVRLIKPSLPPQADRPSGHAFREGSALSQASRLSAENLPNVQATPDRIRYTTLFSPTAPAPTASTILLRPAPPSPIRRNTPPKPSRWLPEPAPPAQRFAPAASLRFSRSNLDPAQRPLSPISRLRPAAAAVEKDLVEIPRFKKRDLNLGIVRQHGSFLDWERLSWVGLWVAWIAWALVGIFFDVNVLYMLYPSASTGSGRNWTFASAAFSIALFLTIFGIWLGWEVGYEFWRRWRASRPAIEPIYLSLPASLHLSLISFPHFSFLKHVRSSAFGTPHALDIIPETCHLLAQTLAPTIMLLPRAALAVVLLVEYSSQPPAALIGTGAAGAMRDRDPRFFDAANPGQLTSYSRGILIAFVSWAGFRVALLILSWLGLWLYSGRPLAGIIGDETCCFPGVRRRYKLGPLKKQRSVSRRPSHDPSIREVPEKSWRMEEDEIVWAWRERTRARIQDAFELCLIRKGPIPASGFLNQSNNWGAARWREEQGDHEREPRRGRSPTETGHERTPTETGLLDEDLLAITGMPISSSSNVSTTDLPRSRPESGTLPAELPRPQNPSHSRDPSGSSLPWGHLVTAGTSETGEITPRATTLQDSEERLASPVPHFAPTQMAHGGSVAHSERTPTPESSSESRELFYTPGVSLSSSRSFFDTPTKATNGVRSRETLLAKSVSHLASEFGVDKRGSTMSSSEAGDVDDDSIGLLSNKSSITGGSVSTMNNQRDRSQSISTGSRRPSVPGSNSASSQSSRTRSATTAALSRARSSSISLLQKSLAAAAAASDGGKDAMRRVRSGTMTSSSNLNSLAGYKCTASDDDHLELRIDEGRRGETEKTEISMSAAERREAKFRDRDRDES